MTWRRSLGGAGLGPALLGLAALGGMLRLLAAVRQPIGYDEDFSAVVLHADPLRMLDILGRDSAPPLFYLLAWLPAQLTGSLALPAQSWSAPAALRLVPLLAGIATIPLVAAIGRRVAGEAAAFCSAAVVALLPATVALSAFARPYALAGAFTLTATLLIWRAADRPSKRRWLAYAAMAAAAVWTDYFAAVALAGVLVAGVWQHPTRSFAAAALASTVAAVASLTPWLIYAHGQFEHAGGPFWLPPLSPTMLAGTIGQLFAGPPVDAGFTFGPGLIVVQCVAVAVALAAAAGFVAAWPRLAPESRRSVIFCLMASSGVAFLTLASIWRPLLDARYAGIMWLPILALLGIGLASVPRPAGLALAGVLAVASLSLSVAATRPEMSWLAPELDARVGTHDLVAADPSHYLVLLDEAGARVRGRLHVLAAQEPPWYDGTAAYPVDAVIGEVPGDVLVNGGAIFWVANPGAEPPGLPSGYEAKERRCVSGACLTVYLPGR